MAGVPALVLALAACGRAPDEPTGLSADESRQLNEAAEMLDANSVKLERVGNVSEGAAP